MLPSFNCHIKCRPIPNQRSTLMRVEQVTAGAGALGERAGEKIGEVLARKGERSFSQSEFGSKTFSWIRKHPITSVAIVIVANSLAGAFTALIRAAAVHKS